jgi:hypothetical protein
LRESVRIESGPLAQLVEHLTLNQGVTGSIPVRLTIFARVAELADAPGLGPGGVTPIGVQVPSLAPQKIQILKKDLKLILGILTGLYFIYFLL